MPLLGTEPSSPPYDTTAKETLLVRDTLESSQCPYRCKVLDVSFVPLAMKGYTRIVPTTRTVKMVKFSLTLWQLAPFLSKRNPV